MVFITLAVPFLAVAAYLEAPTLRAEYRFRAAQKAQKHRDFADARNYLLANLGADPCSARDYFLLARVARQSGVLEDAEEALDLCEKWEGPTSRVTLERTLLNVQRGALNRHTETQLRTYVEQGHAESLQILEALSVGCLVSYRFGAAVTYLSKWIEMDPNDFQAYAWRSLAKERLVDKSGACADAQEAVAIAPRSFAAQLRLGQSLLVSTAYRDAEAVFERLNQDYPHDPLVAMGLARAQLKLNPQGDQAEHILEDLVTRFPNDPPVLLERARLALQLGEPARAESWLRKAVDFVPWDYETQYALLQSLRQQRKLKEAAQVEKTVRGLEEDSDRLRDLNEQFKISPEDPANHCAIASIYLKQGNAKEALHWLQAALNIDPHHLLANQLLADYHEKIGESSKAARYREAAN
jgi:tetratricopeptide (TPR) repeat protein